MNERLPITPDTRVAALLAAYPELEETLVAIAPPFAKLRNPVLRSTIAKVTSLRRAADVAGLPVRELVTQLRAAAGLPAAAANSATAEVAAVTVLRAAPEWTRRVTIGWRLDADALLATGREPLGEVGRRLVQLGVGAAGIIESSFVPAPLLEWLANRGCDTACVAEGDGYRTWVRVTPHDS